MHAKPIWSMDVSEIDDGKILKVLEPIWTTKTETASRVRQRIEVILDWAKEHKYRDGDNPARWKGHLDKLSAAIVRLMTVRSEVLRRTVGAVRKTVRKIDICDFLLI